MHLFEGSRILFMSGLTFKEKILLFRIEKINAAGESIPSALYLQLRDFEERWIERNYDLSTVEGINAIPTGAKLRRPPTQGVTGEIYYYLRRKGYQYEKEEKLELAIACLTKSVAILMNNEYFSPDECYPLVKMLARAGFKEDACQIKEAIDNHFSALPSLDSANHPHEQPFSDLVIMTAHGSVCSECAKYQGRVYSISGKSRLFPKVPDFYHRGSVHPGCGHMFWSYIHGVNDPQLDYTLSVHPLQNPRYGRDIVTFSNRPFVDDRTDECKQAAEKARAELAARLAKEQEYRENMIEIEFRRGQEARDFKWLQSNIPKKCPKSLSGFRRMKTQNTKNYQLLQKAAADLGRKI